MIKLHQRSYIFFHGNWNFVIVTEVYLQISEVSAIVPAIVLRFPRVSPFTWCTGHRSIERNRGGRWTWRDLRSRAPSVAVNCRESSQWSFSVAFAESSVNVTLETRYPCVQCAVSESAAGLSPEGIFASRGVESTAVGVRRILAYFSVRSRPRRRVRLRREWFSPAGRWTRSTRSAAATSFAWTVVGTSARSP